MTATSIASYVELRPVASDSIPDSLTVGTSLVRQSPIGLVSCPSGHAQCYFYRSLDVTHTIPFTQDVEGTAWGFGQGVSVYAHLRARANLGGVTELWTRENDAFTSLAAYVELDRAHWTARAGRQWLTSELGVNNFDGASLAVRPVRGLVVEGYGGRALVQGLSEPYTSSELAQADAIPPDVGGAIFGVTTSWRGSPGAAVNMEYQRVIRDDRAGFYSDRLSIDAVATLSGTLITEQSQIDLASSAINEFRVRASHAMPWNLTGSLEGVHSNPFFPLWTIWGVFAPVGFNEARVDTRWQSKPGDLALTLAGGYRQYQDTHTGVGFLPLRNNGWTLIGSALWRTRPGLEFDGYYRRDIGFGASKSDGSLGARWSRNGGAFVGVTGSATQTIYEFRLANGYLVGGTIDGGVPLGSSLRLTGQVGVYRQIASNTPSTTVNWSQHRALLRLEWSGGNATGAGTTSYGGASR
jgi:hypothetical protein